MDETDAPDPLETVHVLKSDFDLLQAAATGAHEDYLVLVQLLGITPPAGTAPRQVMHEMVFPTIAGMVGEISQVAAASRDIEGMVAAAKARGGNTIDLGDGRKAVLAGRKRPELLAGLQPVTRREMERARGRRR